MILPISEQITFLYTRDLSKSAAFYGEVLGLTLVVDQGKCRVYQVTDRQAYIGICERDTAPEKPEGLIFTIVTPDVDGWYERLTTRGVECDNPPRITEEYGIYHFFLRDPNGYLLEIQRFLNDEWNKPK